MFSGVPNSNCGAEMLFSRWLKKHRWPILFIFIWRRSRRSSQTKRRHRSNFHLAIHYREDTPPPPLGKGLGPPPPPDLLSAPQGELARRY
ncbi:hypothetical protein TNCV_127981 [Trichonephila clavipes]|nr:hypothetical protein TNCV_127981 [Trichonephila clavipes]